MFFLVFTTVWSRGRIAYPYFILSLTSTHKISDTPRTAPNYRGVSILARYIYFYSLLASVAAILWTAFFFFITSCRDAETIDDFRHLLCLDVGPLFFRYIAAASAVSGHPLRRSFSGLSRPRFHSTVHFETVENKRARSLEAFFVSMYSKLYKQYKCSKLFPHEMFLMSSLFNFSDVQKTATTPLIRKHTKNGSAQGHIFVNNEVQHPRYLEFWNLAATCASDRWLFKRLSD